MAHIEELPQSAVDGLTPDGGARREGLPSVPPMADLEPQRHNSRRDTRGRRTNSPRHSRSQSPDRQRWRIDPQALEDRDRHGDNKAPDKRKMDGDRRGGAKATRPLATRKIVVGALHHRKQKVGALEQATLKQGRPGLVTLGLRERDLRGHILKKAPIGPRARTRRHPGRRSCPDRLICELCLKKGHGRKRMSGHSTRVEFQPFSGGLLGRTEASR